MKLSTSDAKLFYELMWALQFFVNQRLGLIENVSSIEEYCQRPQEDNVKVREALFSQPALIADFVSENPFHLPSDQLDIVSEWQYFVKEQFYIERYLKTHAIFIGNQVYGVFGLTEALEDIIPKQRLPFAIKAILLPFKNCIIYDGLFESYNIYFGSGIKGDLKERYLKAKQQDAIIVSLGTKASLTLANKTLPAKEKIEVNWQKELEILSQVAGKLRGGSGQNPINSPVFSLIKASIALADTAINSPHEMDVIYKAIKKAERALKQTEDAFYRIEDGE